MLGARLRAAATAAVAAAVAVAGVSVSHGLLALHSCVDGGVLDSLALHVSVLRPSAACPSGSYALGPASGSVVLVLSVALPVLVAHLLLAACGVGVCAALRVRLRRVADAGRRYLRRLRPGTATPVRRLALPCVDRSWTAPTRELLEMLTWSHRGPPALA
jgi:hypothetical protein